MVFRSARIGPPAIALAAAAALCAAEVVAILCCTSGRVLFSQDDPYIHLALAERLATRFHYGINLGEASSPASSILYPFLLAIGVSLGLGAWGALALCVGATLASAVLIVRILAEAGYRLDRLPPWAMIGLAVLIPLGLNLIGAAFTGLEHALHIALMLGAILGAQRFLRGGGVGRAWLVCAGLCPLVRYEGVAFWLGIILMLAWHRRWRAALVLFAATGAVLAAFSLWLHAHGLPALPSSVLSKAAMGAGGTGLAGWLGAHLRNAMLSPNYKLILLAACLCCGAVLAGWRARDGAGAWIGLLGLIVCGAQMVVGNYGNVGRYEAYALACGMVCAAAGLARPLAPILAAAPDGRLGIGLAVALLVFHYDISLALQTPLAARNIYDQPFQLGRFARIWGAPVGVNDIGEVSFHNPRYVLDLTGLASEEARRAAAGAPDPRWMDRLARRHDVGLVMIFRDWFPHVPDRWIEVAAMTLTGPDLVTGGAEVAFYATSANDAPRIRALLADFAATLPPRERITMPGTAS